MKLKHLFANCMHDVDFDKITSVMELLNWRWYGHPNIPTEKEMFEMCERLFISAKSTYKTTGEPSESSSGGFEVRVKKGYVAVNFILDYNEYDNSY